MKDVGMEATKLPPNPRNIALRQLLRTLIALLLLVISGSSLLSVSIISRDLFQLRIYLYYLRIWCIVIFIGYIMTRLFYFDLNRIVKILIINLFTISLISVTIVFFSTSEFTIFVSKMFAPSWLLAFFMLSCGRYMKERNFVRRVYMIIYLILCISYIIIILFKVSYFTYTNMCVSLCAFIFATEVWEPWS